ncbi:MAG: hypothetical protein RIB53_06000 [Roseitalea porphyridii]|jgi:hypothetical protein|uniref:hypothetical protein n=1 Tax=Roseitalea porphyridii TaxID=1852022 RepID=UPI0032EBBA1E
MVKLWPAAQGTPQRWKPLPHDHSVQDLISLFGKENFVPFSSSEEANRAAGSFSGPEFLIIEVEAEDAAFEGIKPGLYRVLVSYREAHRLLSDD